MPELEVELYGHRLGTLSGSWRDFDFAAHPDAIARWGLDSQILSVAAPLAPRPPRAGKQRRQNVFHELVPEGRALTRLAAAAAVPAHDTIGLLRAYGRDIAGALQIWDRDQPGEPRTPAIEPVDGKDVARMLAEVTDRPLGNAPTRGKTSLAGVEDKIVLARTGDTWNRVLDGRPSTHILKPASAAHPTVIYDEEYGARIARAVGLASFATWIDNFAGTPALVIERYDRAADAPGGRLHQEDFNQVLGARGDQKYQNIGGVVSLARVARALTSAAGVESLRRLLAVTTLAAAVGNLDLHTKNLSLLHPPDGTMTLAPAYDVVPQTHHDNDGLMALAVDAEYAHAALTREHLIREGLSWGLADAAGVVDATLAAVREAAASEAPHALAHAGLRGDVERFAANLADGRQAGSA